MRETWVHSFFCLFVYLDSFEALDRIWPVPFLESLNPCPTLYQSFILHHPFLGWAFGVFQVTAEAYSRGWNIFHVGVFFVIVWGRTLVCLCATDWRKVWLGCPTVKRCHFDLLVTAAQAGTGLPVFFAAVWLTVIISKLHTPASHHPWRVCWASTTMVMVRSWDSAHSISWFVRFRLYFDGSTQHNEWIKWIKGKLI